MPFFAREFGIDEKDPKYREMMDFLEREFADPLCWTGDCEAWVDRRLTSDPSLDGGMDRAGRTAWDYNYEIAGAGPDGRGAIVDDCLDGRTTHNSAWGPVLRRVELSDDATIGGADRFDVRVRAGTSATAVGGIYGPGKNLTIKTTGWFGLINLPIDVESVLVTGGGVFRPEAMGEANFKIPGGITLDNGTLHGYGSTYPTNVAVNVEAGGGIIDAQSGTTTFKGPVNVKEGATLTLNGANVLTFNGAMNVAGTLRNTASTRNLAGPFTGAGFENTGGDLYLANGFTSGDIAVSLSSGHVFMKEGSRAGVINVNETGGVAGFFTGSGTAPQFTEFNVNKVSGTPGLDIRPQATGMMDVFGKVNANFDGTGTIYVYGAARDGESVRVNRGIGVGAPVVDHARNGHSARLRGLKRQDDVVDGAEASARHENERPALRGGEVDGEGLRRERHSESARALHEHHLVRRGAGGDGVRDLRQVNRTSLQARGEFGGGRE